MTGFHVLSWEGLRLSLSPRWRKTRRLASFLMAMVSRSEGGPGGASGSSFFSSVGCTTFGVSLRSCFLGHAVSQGRSKKKNHHPQKRILFASFLVFFTRSPHKSVGFFFTFRGRLIARAPAPCGIDPKLPYELGGYRTRNRRSQRCFALRRLAFPLASREPRSPTNESEDSFTLRG